MKNNHIIYLTEPDSFAMLKDQYLTWMRVHNYASSTVDRTDYMLMKFMDWCALRGITQPKEVTRMVLERYQRTVYAYRTKDGKPLKMSTQANHLTHVVSFFKWLSKQRKIVYNPASEIEMPKREKHLPKRLLTAKQVERILSQPNTKNPFGLRDRAILEVLYSTGMRRTELTNLKIYDFYMEQGMVAVRQGKGKKDRMIPIGDRALHWVERYLNHARPQMASEPDEGFVFLTKTGKPMGPGFVSARCSHHIKKAGIEHGGSCHVFRHTFATLMLEGGADIRYIQHMLGHEKLDTTQIYTQVAIKKLKEIHTAIHPGNQGPGSGDQRPEEEFS